MYNILLIVLVVIILAAIIFGILSILPDFIIDVLSIFALIFELIGSIFG